MYRIGAFLNVHASAKRKETRRNTGDWLPCSAGSVIEVPEKNDNEIKKTIIEEGRLPGLHGRTGSRAINRVIFCLRRIDGKAKHSRIAFSCSPTRGCGNLSSFTVHKRVFRLPQETRRRKRLLVLLDEKREFTAALQSEQFRVTAFLLSLMTICSEWTISKADREMETTFKERQRGGEKAFTLPLLEIL